MTSTSRPWSAGRCSAAPLDDAGMLEVLAPYAPAAPTRRALHRGLRLPPPPLRPPLLPQGLPRHVIQARRAAASRGARDVGRRLADVRVTVLVGGVGGARFLLGLKAALGIGPRSGSGRRGRGRARDHRGGQRRRRHLAARAADLPRPGHLHVHPGRRHRHRARLGPGRRDLGGARRAGRLRRRPVLVRARRPGHRHPPGAHPDAARRLPALRRHRGAVPPLAARA